jgi:hypothetical protein
LESGRFTCNSEIDEYCRFGRRRVGSRADGGASGARRRRRRAIATTISGAGRARRRAAGRNARRTTASTVSARRDQVCVATQRSRLEQLDRVAQQHRGGRRHDRRLRSASTDVAAAGDLVRGEAKGWRPACGVWLHVSGHRRHCDGSQQESNLGIHMCVSWLLRCCDNIF